MYTLALAALVLTQPSRFQIGKPLPTISATAACGRWTEKAGLRPDTYGKTRGVSPATSPDTKLVLYTTTLSDEFFTLARALDRFVGEHPSLGWSFVQVSDPKGASYGGYTAEELALRLKEVAALAQKHGIKHLSFVIAAPSSPPSPQVTLAHVAPAVEGKRPKIDWLVEAPLTDIQKDLQSHLAQLARVVP